jgi:hypothetical protein
LLLNTNCFLASGESYKIYQNSSISGSPNDGCLIYVGGAGNLTVLTSGGEEILFTVPAGIVIPVKVTKVLKKAITASGIIALF